jgi:hypothetical protein
MTGVAQVGAVGQAGPRCVLVKVSATVLGRKGKEKGRLWGRVLGNKFDQVTVVISEDNHVQGRDFSSVRSQQ